MPKPGKSAAGKGSAKYGMVMPGSKIAAGKGSGSAPPKTKAGMMQSGKSGK